MPQINSAKPETEVVNLADAARTHAAIKSSDGLQSKFVAVIIAILPLIYFFPAVIGQVTLAPGDGWTQIFGIRVLAGEMIRSGQIPLWNPFIFAGMPLLASVQPGVLYPPSWLFAILNPQTAMNILVITTYHIALIGTYLYARRVGINRAGAVISGITFSFGGYLIAHLGHTNRINAAVWLPWVLLAIEQLYRRASWRWVALGAIFIALQLFAGDPQMTLYTAIVAGAYAIFALVFRPAEENRPRFILAAVAMSVCGVLLSMVQLLPELEMLKLGDRANIGYEYFSQFSFPPRQVLGLFVPYFFGGAALPPYQVQYWGEWNNTETCGYMGMIAWLLALAAIIAQLSNRMRSRLIWFWSLCAIAALILAFGANLPFGINNFLHHMPVYKLFRASGRHLLEFTFAIGILAGFGITMLTDMPRNDARRTVIYSSGVMASIMIVVSIIYCFFADRLVTIRPLPAGANSIGNMELIVPIVFFVLSAAALFVFLRSRSRLSSIVVAAFLFLDLMSFGFFYEWRMVDFNIAERLADTPAVKFIKDRESDRNAFRIVSRGIKPLERNYDALDYPNISVIRGLQSVNGYDPFRIVRATDIAGTMTIEGEITDTNSLNLADRGFDLLNVKYILNGREGGGGEPGVKPETVEHDGIKFSGVPLDLKFERGIKAETPAGDFATEIAIISAMGNSTAIENDSPVVKIRLFTKDGRVIERELRAGRDTSEWAIDRPDVRAIAKHGRAKIVESWPVEGFEGHRYLAKLQFERSEIDHVIFDFVAAEGDIHITRAALFDSTTGVATNLTSQSLPFSRWQKLSQFGEVELYENKKMMPRAWVANHIAVLPSKEVLQTIKSGKMNDGSAFEPAKVVLLEREIFGDRSLGLPIWNPANAPVEQSDVNVVHYDPGHIELRVKNAQPGFLVLSEIYYRGWEAWVDGRRTPVERVDYTLRGIALPAGEHVVHFAFASPTFRTGSLYSALGAVLLAVGGALRLRKRRK